MTCRRCETRDLSQEIFGPDALRRNGFRQREKERRCIHGTRTSFAPQTASFHPIFVRETADTASTAQTASPIAKDVPVLRFSHATQPDMLSGVRQDPQPSLTARGVSAIRIRVCLQAYRKCPVLSVPLGAGLDVGVSPQAVKAQHRANIG